MTLGLTTYRNDTSVMIDSLTRGGVLIDVIQAAQGTSGSQSYARVNSTANLYYVFARAGSHNVSISMVSGMATINWAYRVDVAQADSVIFVFAKNLVSSEPFGIEILNDYNEVVADQGYASPQYAGQVSFGTTPSLSYTTADGYTAMVFTSSSINIRITSDRMLLLAMPNSGTDDTWYRLKKEYMVSGEAGSVDLVVYTKATSVALPTLHVYALNKAVASSDLVGMKIYDATLNLTFDSGAETLSGRDSFSMAYPAYGATNTYALSFSSTPGASIPVFSTAVESSDHNWFNKFVGVIKRNGSQLTSKQIFDSQIQNNNQGPYPYMQGPDSGRYCPVADVSAVGPSFSTVATSTSTSTYPSFTTKATPAVHQAPGTSFTWTVAVAGTPTPTVQWYFNGVAISGATGLSYTRNFVAGDDGGAVSCKATNAVGEVSCVSTLKIDYNTLPVFTGVNCPTTASIGQTITCSFSASGTPTPTCTISGAASANGSGSASVQFTPQAAGEYTFNLKASNVVGDVTSTATVTVEALPVFSTQPQSKSVSSGSTVQFTVQVSGAIQTTTFQWYRNGVAISGATSNTYTFVCSMSNNGNTFYCKATNGVGTTQSNTATLTVTQSNEPASISVAPTATDMMQGGTTTLSVGVNGYPTPSVVWTVDGVQVGTGATCVASISGTGSKTATCSVSNSTGSDSDTASFFVYSNYSVSINPPSVSATAGQTVTFTVTISGNNASVAGGWTLPNGLGNTGSGANHELTVTAGPDTAGTYTFNSFYPGDLDYYGNKNTTATLTIPGSGPAAPVISSQPANRTITQGGDTSFSVTASPVTGYQWYRNGVALSGETAHDVYVVGNTVGTFTYFCRVFNGSAYTDSSSATLTVNAAAANTFTSYGNVNATIYGADDSAEFDFMTAGNTTSGNWGNGGGDGTLYSIYATGNFTPDFGSASFGTWYNFPSGGGIGYISPAIPPNSNGSSAQVTRTMNYSIRLNSTGQTVSSGTITMIMINSGNA